MSGDFQRVRKSPHLGFEEFFVELVLGKNFFLAQASVCELEALPRTAIGALLLLAAPQ